MGMGYTWALLPQYAWDPAVEAHMGTHRALTGSHMGTRLENHTQPMWDPLGFYLGMGYNWATLPQF